ncbi:AAA family ATPase [Paraburkholderia sp. GAS42]|jgi:transitional endoplasmic reticulum ATPase|uniref:AAA family ATPase n=1 Tax=Paraburkholderia sp. GAS42 TaxID=3035135 RepID=UPI003D25E4CC
MKPILRYLIKAVFLFGLALLLYVWAHATLAGFHMDAPISRSHRLWTLGFTFFAGSMLWLSLRQYPMVRWLALAMIGAAVSQVLFPFDSISLAALVSWVLIVCFVVVRPGKRKPQASPATVNPDSPASTSRHPEEPLYEFDNRIAVPTIRFNQIVGMTETKSRLLRAGAEIVRNTAERPRNGILLSGEPGNGKTMFAEALAGELGVPFFSLSYQDIASKWINETPVRVKAAFARATKLDEGVFFIDEIDAFLKPRGDGSHHMDRDLTNVMLTELVRLRATRIVIVGACNNSEWLDAAAIREGRFDFKITVPPPDLDARRAILSRSVANALDRRQFPPLVLATLAERWEGFSAARLASLGAELADMQREGLVGTGSLTFDTAMQAMRRLQGSKGRLPECVKPIGEILMPEISQHALHDLAFKLQHAYNFEKLGGRLPRGVLFYGAPGTGKTQGAMSLAAASGCAFLKTTGAELLANPSSWDQLVKDAKNLRPAIVFIDEADDVLRERRVSGVAAVTNKILTSIDGADGRVRDVLYVAATNRPESLDGAAIRGGRFEQQIRFEIPGEDALAAYVRTKLKKLAGNMFSVSRQTTEYVVGGLRGRSIADADAVLQRVIDSAALRQLRDGADTIVPADVRAALGSTTAQGLRTTV